jgi:hypothetical protein
MALFAIALSLNFSAAYAQGQGDQTPDDLEGRLGGSLQQVIDSWGDPNWSDNGLIGYNIIPLANIDTIVVVYFDDDETVTQFSLVYLEVPSAFVIRENIKNVVSEVAPRDGECESEALAESGLGREVYACNSGSLSGQFTADDLETFGIKGEDGSYSYSVDPIEDAYFEIIVQFGTDSVVITPTPVPTAPPPPTPTPSLSDEYPPVSDIRELVIGRGYLPGDTLSFSGVVETIFVDGPITQLQVSVQSPAGTREWVIVVFDSDSSGIFEGTWVTVYGFYFGKECFVNRLGGEVCQPAILAVQVDR